MLWLGRASGFEGQLVARRGLPFLDVAAAPMVDRGPIARARGLWDLLRGARQAWREAGRRRPDALLVTGGFVSVPVALAARLRRIPILVYLPDILPGRAVRLIARWADRVAVTDARAARHLPAGKARVTGYPVRRSLRQSAGDARAARQRLGIESKAPLLLVFGGSQGARSLNRALIEAAPKLPPDVEVLWICGPRNEADARMAIAKLDEDSRARLHLRAYLHDEEMADALAAADLALCRAGAATLGELPAAGLPAILVPLPISGGHQWPNAEVLVEAGAALALADEELDGPRLAELVAELLGEPARLTAMTEAARALDKPDAPREIWRLLAYLAARDGQATG